MSTHLPSTQLRLGGLGVLLLLAGALSACGVGPATAKDKIAKTTGTYLRAMADGDAATACAQLSPRAGGDRCRQAVNRELSRLSPAMLKRSADASLDISVHGRTATASLGQPHDARLILVTRGRDWRIDSGFTVPTASRARPAAS